MDFFKPQTLASTERDYADLARQARYMMRDILDDRSLLEPLMGMVERLSFQPLYARDAMDMFSEVAQNPYCNKATKQRAIDGFNRSAQSIVDDADRIEAFINSGKNAEESEIKRHIAAGILWSARNLSGLLKAQAFFAAAHHAPPGTALERQAVEKCVLAGDAIPAPHKPANFFAEAAVEAPAGSLLEEKIVDAFIRHVNQITNQPRPISRRFVKAGRAIIESQTRWEEPVYDTDNLPNYDHKERMARFFSTAGRADVESLLEQRATAEYMLYVELVSNEQARIEIYIKAAKASRAGSLMKHTAIEGILRNASAISPKESVMAFHLVRKQAVDTRDKFLEKRTITAHLTHRKCPPVRYHDWHEDVCACCANFAQG